MGIAYNFAPHTDPNKAAGITCSFTPSHKDRNKKLQWRQKAVRGCCFIVDGVWSESSINQSGRTNLAQPSRARWQRQMIHYWLGLTFLGCWENGCSDEGRRVWNHSVLQMMLIPVPLMGWAVVVERLAFWFQRRRKCKHGVGNWGGKLRSSWNVANAVVVFVVVVFNALSFWGVEGGGWWCLERFFLCFKAVKNPGKENEVVLGSGRPLCHLP